MRKFASLFSVLAIFAAPGLSLAAFITATATLDGLQEVPSNGSSATGFITVTVDDTTNLFDATLTVDGIFTADLTGAGGNSTPVHLHNAPPGSNGGIVVDLAFLQAPSDTATGFEIVIDDLLFGGTQGAIVSDPATNLAELIAGNIYVNVHTSAFPAGEIRGDLAIPEPSTFALGAFGMLAAGAIAYRRRTSKKAA